MDDMPDDIFTETEDVDLDTLRNLGPLRALAGVWEGLKGADVAPKAYGPERREFMERIELQPIDPQSNGPQLLYGLRYETRIEAEGEDRMFHHQLGHWLWEPATGLITLALSIPRAQVALAGGRASADATTFEVSAERGSTEFGICSGPFLERNFRTDAFRMKVTANPDGTWSYSQTTTLTVRGQGVPFAHTDQNTLRRVAAPTPNPAMKRARG